MGIDTSKILNYLEEKIGGGEYDFSNEQINFDGLKIIPPVNFSGNI